MNKLSDYPLQRGDWVKLKGEEWLEFSERHQDRFNSKEWSYYFITGICSFLGSSEVEAVLRPPFIMRDMLKKVDTNIFCKSHLVPLVDMKTGQISDLEFKCIHPRKEEKSLLAETIEFFEDEARLTPTCHAILKLAAEIDKLKEAVKK